MTDVFDDRLVQAASIGKKLLADNESLVGQIDRLKSELNSTVTQFEIMSMKNIELQAVNSTNEDEIRLLSQSLHNARSDIDKLTAQYEALKLKYRQSQYLEDRITNLTTKLEERAQRIDELEKLLIKRNDQLLNLSSEHDSLSARIKSLTQIDANYQELKQQISELIVENKQLKFELEKYDRQHQHFTSEISTLTEANTKLTLNIDTYRSDNSRLISELSLLEKDRTRLAQSLAERDQFLKSLNDKTESLTQLEEQHKSLIEKYESEKTEWYDRHDQLEESVKYYNDKHVHDCQKIDLLTHELDQLRKDMKTYQLETDIVMLDLKSQLSKDGKTIDDYSRQLTQLQRQLKHKQIELENTMDKLQHGDELREKILTSLKSEHQAYIDQLIDDHQVTLSKIKQTHSHEISILQSEINLLTKTIEELRQRHTSTLDSFKDKLEAHDQQREQQLELLRKQLETKDLVIEEMKSQLDIYQTEKNEQHIFHTKLYNELYADLNKQISDLQAEVKAWKDKVESTDTDDKDEQIRKLKIKLTQLQTEKELLTTKVSITEDSNNDVPVTRERAMTEIYNVTQIVDRTKIVKDSFIYRRTSRGKWKRVYAFIEDDVLFYSKNQVSKYKCKGIKLYHTKTIIENVDIREDVRKYYIKLIDTDGREYHLAFETRDDMIDWTKKIKKISNTVDPTK